jgi:hypothetical protein
MNERVRFVPPSVDFDPRLANELTRREATLPAADEAPRLIAGRRSPFNGYVRMLTPEGGILILYQDQKRSVLLTCLRVFASMTAFVLAFWLVFFPGSFSVLKGVALVTLVTGLILYWKIKVQHSVEIRPDAMIVDGEDVFYAEDIGDNWPELQMKDDDPDRMVISGICGTRFVEYMTAHRLDKNDRTPEILAADLKAAMEQLWGRREVTFAAPF